MKNKNTLASNNPINLALARKVVKIVSAGLTGGLDDGHKDENGKPIPGHMCVEAAVCFAIGQDHGDQPKCVAPVVRDFKIQLNDADGWSYDMSRAEGLKRIAVAQLGSNKIQTKTFLKALRTVVNGATPEDRIVKILQDAVNDDHSGFLQTLSDAKISKAAKQELLDAYVDANGIAVDEIDAYSGGGAVDEIIGLDSTPCGEDGLCKVTRIGIEALRLCNSPGIKLMDQLIAKGVL